MKYFIYSNEGLLFTKEEHEDYEVKSLSSKFSHIRYYKGNSFPPEGKVFEPETLSFRDITLEDKVKQGLVTITNEMKINNGNIVRKTERELFLEGLLSIDNYKTHLIGKINKLSQRDIISGIKLNDKIYDTTLEDQINLIGAVVSGLDIDFPCIKEGSYEKENISHTSSQMKNILKRTIEVKNSILIKARELKNKIKSLDKDQLIELDIEELWNTK